MPKGSGLTWKSIRSGCINNSIGNYLLLLPIFFIVIPNYIYLTARDICYSVNP